MLRVLEKGDLQIAEHDIFLGLNIPNYPKSKLEEQHSGLHIGEENPSFIPFHAWGPDQGTRTCPVCKYGRYHGIVYFVGNHPNWDDIEKWLTFLEQESESRERYLKVYFVYGNENNYDKDSRAKELQQIGQELDIKNVALTFVPSLLDKASEVYRNQINPEVQNTMVIYRHRVIIDKFVDLEPTQKNFSLIDHALDRTQSVYFELNETRHE